MGPLITAIPAVAGLLGNLFGKKDGQNSNGQMSGLGAFGLGVAPGIFGLLANKQDQARRNAQEGRAAAGFSKLTDILQGRLGQSYLGSTEGMGLMKEIDQNASSQMDQVNAMANMSGLTDEAKIAMMGRVMSGKQNAYAGLARNEDLFRQRNLRNYQGALSNLFQAGMANRQMQQNSLNNVVGGFQTAVDGAMNAGVFDKLLAGNKNKSQGAQPEIEASKYLWGY